MPVNLNPPSVQQNPFGNNNPFSVQTTLPTRTIGNGAGLPGSMSATPPVSGNAPTDGSGSTNATLMGGLTDALGGLGDYMSGVGATKQANAGIQANLSNNIANLLQHQNDQSQSAANSVMNANKPGSDIDPYANMALRKALMDGYTPQTITPNGVTGGFDMSGLKGVMDKYYDENAIRASMEQQQKLAQHVDPNTPLSNAGLQIYGPGYQSNMDSINADRDGAQTRQYNQQSGALQALQQALSTSQNNSKGSFWGGLGSMLAKAAPAVMTALL